MSRHTSFDEHTFPFSDQNKPLSTPAPTSQPSTFTLLPTSLASSKFTSHSNLPSTRRDSILPPADQNVPAPLHTIQEATINPSQPPPPSTTTAKVSCHPMITRRKTGSLKQQVRLNLQHLISNAQQAADPTSYTEAVKHSHWRHAMASEFFALQTQGTWTLVEQPNTASIIGCKWTYRTKYNSDGSIARYKARLVALGNHQEHGIDYHETFSPVAKLPTIQILLTVALHNNWPVQQLDVANAFLHGNLQETVYMAQPKGFEDSIHPHYVCNLNKAIYGLKQAPRQWYNTFTSYLISLGFKHSKSDPSLLILQQKRATIYLLVYVDDILLTGDNSAAITELLDKLNIKFAMKTFRGQRINIY
ncbi:hypothetical protein KFK09_004599 [Dendrobium nobile]|uniref:Reverse transcriptase Ty1/copia-type domain-containing protein n=1 Tax=Dendrobium nobile TaxID=94219 RepID=A0A8T3C664_DENNO|nr:hypothetical protein KFK09_004599 [Dendrobium nobile]